MNRELLMLLRQQAYDRYLALWLAPAPSRDFLLALFSLEQELLHLPHKVANPTLGVMRVTWWRDRLLDIAQVPAHPVLQALVPYRNKAVLLADYTETFDAAFYEDGQTQRLEARADYLAALLQDCFALPLVEIRQGARVIYGLDRFVNSQSKSLKLLGWSAKEQPSRLQLTMKALALSF